MKKLLIIIGALIALTAIISIIVYRVPLEEKYIRFQIKGAGYCTDRFDCTAVKSSCPFGCNIYVNRDEKEKVQDLIDTAPRKCEYRCPVAEEIICKQNRCQVTY